MTKIQNSKTGEIFSIDRAIFYGCSNTAGTELADHFIIGKSFDETNKIKKSMSLVEWNKSIHELANAILPDAKTNMPEADTKAEAYRQLGLRYSYGTVLCDMLKVRQENFAIGGTSNKSTLFKIMRDLNSGFYKPGDVVFIGLTTLERDLLFNSNGDFSNILYAFPEFGCDEHKEHIPSLIIANSTYTKEFNFCNQVLLMYHLLKSAQIPVFFLFPLGKVKYLMIRNQIENDILSSPDIWGLQNNIKSLLHMFDNTLETIEPVSIDKYSLYDPGGNDLEKCAFGHVGPLTNKKYAEQLYDELRVK